MTITVRSQKITGYHSKRALLNLPTRNVLSEDSRCIRKKFRKLIVPGAFNEVSNPVLYYN